MIEPCRIVAASAQDLADIPAIEQEAAAVFPERDLPMELRYRVTDRQTLDEARRDERLWVALDLYGHPVGFALADVLDGEAFLDEVDVRPTHARRGIGSRLVHTVIDWAERREFTTLSLLTFRHLPWNAPFYASLGFAAVSRREMGPGIAAILEEEARAGINVADRVAMRRILSRPGDAVSRSMTP